MKVLLLRPPLHLSRDHIDYPVAVSLPVWTVSAHLKDAGFDVEIVDALQMSGDCIDQGKDYLRLGVSENNFRAALQKKDFDAVILHLDPFSLQSIHRASYRELVGELRGINPSASIALADLHIGGMNYVAYDPARILDICGSPDCLLRYEPEVSLVRWLKDSGAGRMSAVIDGEAIERPRSYGATIYDEVDLKAYSRLLRSYLDMGNANPFMLTDRTLPFKSSRGCNFSCRFCSSHPGGASSANVGWRCMEPNDLLLQIGKLGEIESVEKLWILDEAANTQSSHFDTLLDASDKAGLSLEFPNGLRADRLSGRQIERLASSIGLLSLSPETGSDESLAKHVGKRQPLAAVEKAVRRATDTGLPVALHFIIGFPGETKKETLQTLSQARRMYETYGAAPWIQFAIAVPGTAMFETCKKNGWLPDPLPDDLGGYFQHGPMLADEACQLTRIELRRLRDAVLRVCRGD